MPKILHREPPGPLRAALYAPTGDQLDAIAKGFKALRDAGVTLPQETLDWIEHCDAVKARFTKRNED